VYSDSETVAMRISVHSSESADATLYYNVNEYGVDLERRVPEDVIHRSSVLQNIRVHGEGSVALPFTTSAFESWLTGSCSLIASCQACNVRFHHVLNEDPFEFPTILP
jgi:hypothetical protein